MIMEKSLKELAKSGEIHSQDPLVIAAINYLSDIARQTGENIQDAPILKILDGVDLENKRDINRALFSFLKEKNQTEPAKEKSKTDLAKISDEATKIDEERKKARLESLASSLTQATNALTTRINSVDEQIKRIWQLKKEAYALENRSPSYIAEEIKSAVAGGFWKFHKFDRANRTFELLTENSIVLTEINPAAGINRKVDMGKFLIRIGLNSMSVRVLRHQDNLDCEGHSHPYLNTSGAVCWGNAYEIAAKYQANGEIGNLLSLLASLLTTYDPTSSPYTRLVNFTHATKHPGLASHETFYDSEDDDEEYDEEYDEEEQDNDDDNVNF